VSISACGQAVEEPLAKGLEEICLLDVFLAIEHGHKALLASRLRGRIRT
jgi:hypothetical protein